MLNFIVNLFSYNWISLFLILSIFQNSDNQIIFNKFIKQINVPLKNDAIYILVPSVICKGCVEFYLLQIDQKFYKKEKYLITQNKYIYLKFYQKNNFYTFLDSLNIMNEIPFKPSLITFITFNNKKMNIYSISNTKEEINFSKLLNE